MKVSIIGSGYVGLSTGICLAETGHQVICADIHEDKISRLKKGLLPIYEPGLEKLLYSNLLKKRIEFTTSIRHAVENAPVIIIAVGTPPCKNGDVDMRQVDEAAAAIGRSLSRYRVIVNKSTVPIGTAERVKKIIHENMAKKNTGFDVVSNPEFLREGSAVHDTFNSDRIVLGSRSKKAVRILKKLYSPLGAAFYVTDPESAEMIKYASNAFLATKISFVNEIANLCEKTGANIKDVTAGMGMDKRIGSGFLSAGIGFGGSCFPKDVNGLIRIGEKAGYEFKILKQVIDVNRIQRIRPVSLLEQLYSHIYGLQIGILGLSFKPGTDDIREAPSIYVIDKLLHLGAEIKVYDPAAAANMKCLFGDRIAYCPDPYRAAEKADALLILTEWAEFKELDCAELKRRMKGRIIIDGRNVLDMKKVLKSGFDYYPVGISIKEKNVITESVPRIKRIPIDMKPGKIKAVSAAAVSAAT